ncbi:hypothetical protein DZJ_42260 [Dickeya ananatis]
MMRWFRTGTPWVWLTASAITFSLIAIVAVFALLVGQSARYLWPQPVWSFSLHDAQGNPRQLIGERYDEQPLTHQQLADAGVINTPASGATRYLLKTGWRESYGQSFQTLLSTSVTYASQPADVLAVRRTTNGMAYGYLDGMTEDGQPLVSDNLASTLQQRIAQVHQLITHAQTLRLGEMSRVNQQFDALRLQEEKLRRENRLNEQAQARLGAERTALERHFSALNQQLLAFNADINRTAVLLRDAQGQLHTIPVKMIERAWYPNAMTFSEKAHQTLQVIGSLLTRFEPDDSSPGQLFPAIFGTVLLVILMSVIVMPLGVVAAVYLHEYADNTSLTRWVRVAVANLAGVPSIVYGVFGLGFFCLFGGRYVGSSVLRRVAPEPDFRYTGVAVGVADAGAANVAGGDCVYGRGAVTHSVIGASWLAGVGGDPGGNPVACGAADGGTSDDDRADSGGGASRRGNRAADAGGGGEIGTRTAGGQSLSLSASGAQIYAPGVPDL